MSITFPNVIPSVGLPPPRFVRHFADVRKEVARGVSGYVKAVKDGSFPDSEKEGYIVDPSEWESFLVTEGTPNWTWSPTTLSIPAQEAITAEQTCQETFPESNTSSTVLSQR